MGAKMTATTKILEEQPEFQELPARNPIDHFLRLFIAEVEKQKKIKIEKIKLIPDGDPFDLAEILKLCKQCCEDLDLTIDINEFYNNALIGWQLITKKSSIDTGNNELDTLIYSLEDLPKHEQVKIIKNKIFSIIKNFDDLQIDNVLTEIKKRTNISVAILKKQIKKLKEIIIIATTPTIEYEPKSLEYVKKTIKKWLHIEDTDVLESLLAVAISNKVRGDPIWLFLIAPSGAAKTELLRTFAESSLFYHLSNMTPNTLISGMIIDKKKIEDLLPQLDGKTLIFKDFTVILEKNRDQRNEIISQLRDAYDGTYSKKFGTLDKKVGYDSKFSLIAGVTPIIDKHWKVMQQLGERFLKYRLNEDMDATTERAYRNEGSEAEMRAELKEAIMGFIMNLNVPNDIKFNDSLYKNDLILLAKFIAMVRTPVQTVSSSEDFYFDFEPVPEQPTRLAKQLKKMAKCLAIVRNKNEVTIDELKIIEKIANFTVPQERVRILEFIAENVQRGQEVTLSMIEKHMKLPYSSTHRLLEQLSRLDLISSETIKISIGDKETTYLKYAVRGIAKERYTPLSFNNNLIQKCKRGVSQEKILDVIKQSKKISTNDIAKALQLTAGEVFSLLKQLANERVIFEPQPDFWMLLE